MLDDQLTRIEKKIDRLDQLITGGDSPNSGIIVRVDRIEQREARRDWWTKTAMGAACAACVGTAWKWITKQQ